MSWIAAVALVAALWCVVDLVAVGVWVTTARVLRARTERRQAPTAALARRVPVRS